MHAGGGATGLVACICVIGRAMWIEFLFSFGVTGNVAGGICALG